MKHKLMLFIGGLLTYSCSYLPEDIEIDSNLKVDRGDYAIYYSGMSMPGNAFLMVPGGLVDPHVYSCWINQLVMEDSAVAVVLLKYPSNLAITNINKAMKVTEDLPDIRHWVIGGHSLGGVVAAMLVNKYGNLFDGLVLLASWPAASSDLSEWEGTVLSIYASEDQLAREDEITGNSVYLPKGDLVMLPSDINGLPGHTYYYKISGGNHSGFGCYGKQKGDGEALISTDEQQDLMLSVLKSYFDALW